jgi:hypothetical protein
MKDAVSKYVKPKSLTWWASVFPLFAGLALAFATAVPGMDWLSGMVESLFPGLSAAALVNMGLVGIGLRGAFK